MLFAAPAGRRAVAGVALQQAELGENRHFRRRKCTTLARLRLTLNRAKYCTENTAAHGNKGACVCSPRHHHHRIVVADSQYCTHRFMLPEPVLSWRTSHAAFTTAGARPKHARDNDSRDHHIELDDAFRRCQRDALDGPLYTSTRKERRHSKSIAFYPRFVHIA